MFSKIFYTIIMLICLRACINFSYRYHNRKRKIYQILFIILLSMVLSVTWANTVLGTIFLIVFFSSCTTLSILILSYIAIFVFSLSKNLYQGKDYNIELKIIIDFANKLLKIFYKLLYKLGFEDRFLKYEDDQTLSQIAEITEYYLNNQIKITQKSIDMNFICFNFQKNKKLKIKKIENTLKKLFKNKIETVFVHKNKILLQLYSK